MIRHWQLVAAAIWGVLAIVIFGRVWLFSDEMLDRLPVRNWNLANVMTVLLAVWNFARWYQGEATRRQLMARLPLQPDPNREVKSEYNPELDFHKRPE